MRIKWWLLLIVLVLALAACKENKGATHSDMNNEQQARTEADTQLDERTGALERMTPVVVDDAGNQIGSLLGNVTRRTSNVAPTQPQFMEYIEVFISSLQGSVLIDPRTGDYYRDHLWIRGGFGGCTDPYFGEPYTEVPNPGLLLVSSLGYVYRRSMGTNTLSDWNDFILLGDSFLTNLGFGGCVRLFDAGLGNNIPLWEVELIDHMDSVLPQITGNVHIELVEWEG